VRCVFQSACVGEVQYHLIDAAELWQSEMAAQFMALLGGNPFPRKKQDIPYSVACGAASAVAQQPTAVNGQDERFAPLTAAARRAFWQTRWESTACACPPVHILAIVDIGFSTGVVVGCALFWGVPDAVVYRLSSQGRHSPTRFRRDGMSGRRNLALAIQLCLCRKLRISSFYKLQHQIPDRCVLTALAFSMPML